jgi:hypothetical protein
VPDPGNVRVVARRRRTRRHRRNRLIRRCLAVAALVLVVGASTIALKFLSPSLFRGPKSSSSEIQHVELNQTQANTLDEIFAHAKAQRTVYPYSVVPGGVDDAKELKLAAEHDPVVAAHYAGFDYEHAQVVRLTLARTVFVSYRIAAESR